MMSKPQEIKIETTVTRTVVVSGKWRFTETLEQSTQYGRDLRDPAPQIPEEKS